MALHSLLSRFKTLHPSKLPHGVIGNTTVFGAVVPSSNLGVAANDPPVAQWIEQQTSTLNVDGLNPSWCTICENTQAVEGAVCKTVIRRFESDSSLYPNKRLLLSDKNYRAAADYWLHHGDTFLQRHFQGCRTQSQDRQKEGRHQGPLHHRGSTWPTFALLLGACLLKKWTSANVYRGWGNVIFPILTFIGQQ